jgi:hypothetical protein
VERIIVRCLSTFRTFGALLELTTDEVREIKRELPRLDAALLGETGEVIDDALEYLPPACSCSV